MLRASLAVSRQCRRASCELSVRRSFAGVVKSAPKDDPTLHTVYTGELPTEEIYDVAIVGGGTIGSVLASLLGRNQYTQKLKVALFEPRPPPGISDDGTSKEDMATWPLECRTVAISPATVNILKAAGVWKHLPENRIHPYRFMEVWDASGDGVLRFSADEIGANELGYIVENQFLHAAANLALADAGNLTKFYRPVRLHIPSLATRPPTMAYHIDESNALPVLQIGDTEHVPIRSRLVVGADGSSSHVRQSANLPYFSRDYGQRAVVATVKLESEVETAFQRFLSNGPIAMLPMCNGHANIVWSTTPERASYLTTQCSTDEFIDAVNAAFYEEVEDGPPRPPFHVIAPASRPTPPYVKSVASRRASFPLRALQCTSYKKEHIVVVGDAAHNVHPLAGQGLNIGMQDILELANVLVDGVRTGQSPGDFHLLQKYEDNRMVENTLMVAALDGIKSVFGSSFWPLAWARNAGLTLTDSLFPLKGVFMEKAMGNKVDLSNFEADGANSSPS